MQFATIERSIRILYGTMYCSIRIGQLIDSDPWWTAKKVPDEWKEIHRNDYDALLRSFSIREITMITGVSRFGKSTHIGDNEQNVSILFTHNEQNNSYVPQYLVMNHRYYL